MTLGKSESPASVANVQNTSVLNDGFRTGRAGKSARPSDDIYRTGLMECERFWVKTRRQAARITMFKSKLPSSKRVDATCPTNFNSDPVLLPSGTMQFLPSG